MNIPGKIKHGSYLVDTPLVEKFELGGECEQGVDNQIQREVDSQKMFKMVR